MISRVMAISNGNIIELTNSINEAISSLKYNESVLSISYEIYQTGGEANTVVHCALLSIQPGFFQFLK